ncbi:MAG: GNAT family N-acetyltransferase [Nanoarchaeota archaeon]|nr:GNAT family N-acetyltransferase [Nanoarchaeota archaeon]
MISKDYCILQIIKKEVDSDKDTYELFFEGVPIGFSEIEIINLSEPHIRIFNHIIERQKRRGFGKILYYFIESLAKKKGFRYIIADCVEINDKDAIGFWKAMSFRELTREEAHSYKIALPDKDDTVYIKYL